MTCEAWKNGSKLTVSNPSNPSGLGYVTLFDGRIDQSGPGKAPAAVEIINPKSIASQQAQRCAAAGRDQHVADDNNTINNECIRMDKDGKVMGVTHVTYLRRKQ